MRWESLLVLLAAFALLRTLLGRGGEPPRLPRLDDAPERPGDDPALSTDGEMMRFPVERQARPEPAPEELQGTPVVSLEPLAPRSAPTRMAYDVEPRRAAEHARFHRRAAAQETREPPVAAPLLQLRLHEPGELRRAMLLAEVLGKPRALRPLDEENR